MGTKERSIFIVIFCTLGISYGQISGGSAQLGSGLHSRFRPLGGGLVSSPGSSVIRPSFSRSHSLGTFSNNNNNNNNDVGAQIISRPALQTRRVQIIRQPVRTVQTQTIRQVPRTQHVQRTRVAAPAAPVAAAPQPAAVQPQSAPNPLAMNPMAMNPMAMNPMAMNPMMHMNPMMQMNPMMGGPMGMMGGAMHGMPGMPMMSYDTMEDIFFDPDRPDPLPMGGMARPPVGAVPAVVPGRAAVPAAVPAQAAIASTGTAATSAGKSAVNPSTIASALQTALSRVQKKHGQATVG